MKTKIFIFVYSFRYKASQFSKIQVNLVKKMQIIKLTGYISIVLFLKKIRK